MILLRPNQNPVDALMTVLHHQVDRIWQSNKKQGIQSVFFLLDICDPFAASIYDRIDGEGSAEKELKDDRMEGISNVDSFVHLCPQLMVAELHEAREITESKEAGFYQKNIFPHLGKNVALIVSITHGDMHFGMYDRSPGLPDGPLPETSVLGVKRE